MIGARTWYGFCRLFTNLPGASDPALPDLRFPLSEKARQFQQRPGLSVWTVSLADAGANRTGRRTRMAVAAGLRMQARLAQVSAGSDLVPYRQVSAIVRAIYTRAAPSVHRFLTSLSLAIPPRRPLRLDSGSDSSAQWSLAKPGAATEPGNARSTQQIPTSVLRTCRQTRQRCLFSLLVNLYSNLTRTNSCSRLSQLLYLTTPPISSHLYNSRLSAVSQTRSSLLSGDSVMFSAMVNIGI